MYKIIAVGYLLTYFLFPLRRSIYNGWESGGYQDTIFQLHVWLPLLALVYYLITPNRKAWNNFLQDRNLNIIAIVLLTITISLTAVSIPGWWWTWTTVAIHGFTVLLVIGVTKNKLLPLEAAILGIGVTSLAAGLWEVIYQIGYYTHYNSKDGIPVFHLTAQIAFVLPLIAGGIFAICVFRRALVGINKVSILLLGLSFGALILWNMVGYWVDIIYNWEAEEWQYTEYNYFQSALYRSSKATLALGLVSLYSTQYAKGMGIRLRSLLGYAIIIPWTLMFIATTGFLGLTWVKSLFAKEGKPPYFKTRSIHYDRKFDSPDGGGRN